MTVLMYDASTTVYVEAGLGHVRFPHRFDADPQVWVGSPDIAVDYTDCDGFTFKSRAVETGFVVLTWTARAR